MKDEVFESIPFWSLTDFDQPQIKTGFLIKRLIECYFFSYNMGHPDEYWQSIEPSYNMVYGNVLLPWEWDDAYRLRSVLYPAYLAIPLYVLKITGLDSAAAVRASP